MPKTNDKITYNREGFDSLGVNMQKQLLENAGAIISGNSPEITYGKKNALVKLQFKVENNEVLIDKNIDTGTSSAQTSYFAIPVSELKEKFKEKYGEEVFKILSIAEIKKLKALDKMRTNSEKFNKDITELFECTNKDKQLDLTIKISKEVAIYKKDPQAWILSANEVQSWKQPTRKQETIEAIA